MLNKKSIHPEGVLEDLISRSNQGDFRNVVPYVDFKMQLPEEFLNVTDKFEKIKKTENTRMWENFVENAFNYRPYQPCCIQ